MSNTQIAKTGDLKSLINSDAMKAQFARALPRHLSPDRFVRIAITALTRTPKLQQCTPESLMRCLLDLSATGLEADGRRAHLIPYNNRKAGTVECTLIIDYKGLVELILRSGDVATLRTETVCEFDEFDWLNGDITHKIDWRRPRGYVQAVYAEATLKSGEKQTSVMTREDVEKIRSKSKAANDGPWVDFWDEMAKKTVLKRLAKMLPLSYEIQDAFTKDDAQFSQEFKAGSIDPQAYEIKETPPKPKSKADQIKAQITETTAPAPRTQLDRVLDLCETNDVQPLEVWQWLVDNEEPGTKGITGLHEMKEADLKLLADGFEAFKVNFAEAEE